MHWLNYHHLKYFWIVAQEGSFSRASKTLNLTQPTLSKQIKSLEEFLGEPLFERKGSGLELTDAGNLAMDYANDIYRLGDEFLSNLKTHGSSKPKRLRVGASDALPKLVCHSILQPILALTPPVVFRCEEGPTDRLLADLSLKQLDLVLTDAPVSGDITVKAFNHHLGDCGVSFFATSQIRATLTEKFPDNMEGKKLLLPSLNTTLRRLLDPWIKGFKHPAQIVAEFDDSALMKVFGRESAGIFPAPSVVAEAICREYDVVEIGTLQHIRVPFYAVTIERKLNHPIVMQLVERARKTLFQNQSP